MIVHGLKSLLEQTRRELLTKQKRETPDRVSRSKSYSISQTIINPESFLNNWLVVTTQISGNGHQYTVTIAFKNVITDLIEAAKQDSKHYVNSRLIQKSLKTSLDKNDIFIDCECPDFVYRYAYFATKYKFKYGKLQNSNGQGIRNPNNDIGCMCKHLYALLRSNNFMNHISDKIMRTIMANLDILYKRYKFNLEEFIVNTAAYDRLAKSELSRDSSGKFRNLNQQNNSNNNNQNNSNNEVDNGQ